MASTCEQCGAPIPYGILCQPCCREAFLHKPRRLNIVDVLRVLAIPPLILIWLILFTLALLSMVVETAFKNRLQSRR